MTISSDQVSNVLKDYYHCIYESQDSDHLTSMLSENFQSDSTWYEGGKQAQYLQCNQPGRYVRYLQNYQFTNKKMDIEEHTFFPEGNDPHFTFKSSQIVKQGISFDVNVTTHLSLALEGCAVKVTGIKDEIFLSNRKS